MNDPQEVYAQWAAKQAAKHGERDQPLRVVRLIGLITGQPTRFDGQYVVEYHASEGATPLCAGLTMNAHLVCTDDVARASRFSPQAAMALTREVDQRNPVRRDGKPNRPLSAYTLLVAPPGEAAAWIMTPGCPRCGDEPMLVLDENRQAFCGNDRCEVLAWDMTRAASQLEVNRTEIDASGWE